MQQSASRGCLVVHAEHFGDRIGNERDPYDMVVDMVCMVEKILQFDKFIVPQDIVDQTDIFTPYRSWYQQRYYARPDHRVVQMESNQKDQQCNHNEHQLGEFRIDKVMRGECIGKQEENKQTKRQCDQEPYLPMIPIAKDPCRMWYVQCLPPLWNWFKFIEDSMEGQWASDAITRDETRKILFSKHLKSEIIQKPLSFQDILVKNMGILALQLRFKSLV